jgi:FHA domain
MIDTRLSSAHLVSLPRRQVFRRTREDLLAARGWLTEAAEHVQGMRGGADGWLALPRDRADQVLFGPRSLLIDQQTGCRYRLDIGLNTIGRLRNNDIVLKGYMISRRHCVLLMHAGGDCELHDTASRNGTFVNGQLIRRPVPLASGDWIQVYQKLLRFVSEPD